MMNELPQMTPQEASKSIKQLLRWYVKEEPLSETVYMREAVDMAVKALEPQPKRGKWIGVDETHSICEKCEAIFEISSPNAEVNFCPSCGVLLESEYEG